MFIWSWHPHNRYGKPVGGDWDQESQNPSFDALEILAIQGSLQCTVWNSNIEILSRLAPV